jgi:hypothetical protein
MSSPISSEPRLALAYGKCPIGRKSLRKKGINTLKMIVISGRDSKVAEAFDHQRLTPWTVLLKRMTFQIHYKSTE